MALALTDRGEHQTAIPASGTITKASSAWAPAAGSHIVAMLSFQGNHDSGASSDVTFTIADTWGDSGGVAWSRKSVSSRGAIASGLYAVKTEIWTRTIGTGPASGTMTVTGTFNAGALTTSTDFWLWFNPFEVAGQHATPLGAFSSTGRLTGATTYNAVLSGNPATTSAVFSVLQDDSAAVLGTNPSGYTTGQSEANAWGASYQSAYINPHPGGSTAVTWSGLTSGNNYVGCAIEVVAAAVAGFVSPRIFVSQAAVGRAGSW